MTDWLFTPGNVTVAGTRNKETGQTERETGQTERETGQKKIGQT